jgi:hypothetical protein
MPKPGDGGKRGPTLDLPPAPIWTGDVATYGDALDEWLAALRLRCNDPTWLDWYRLMHGPAPAAAVELPPHPGPGDGAGWSLWWRRWREGYHSAGAGAEGILDPPAQCPDPARLRRRRRFRRRVKRVVSRELVKAIPAIVGVVAEVVLHVK